MTQTAIQDTSPAELDAVLAQAACAARSWSECPPADRAHALRAMADALDADADALVPLAVAESNFTERRLRGELGRTTFQLRLFAGLLEEGSYLQAAIDYADQQWPPGPRPDLRRMLVFLGPVLVFAGSNFPFAFSVAGGDTASALAAGSRVVLKAHPGHPELSNATGQVVAQALDDNGAPDGVVTVVHGDETARSALTDPRIKAGAFTGSLRGGRALFNLAASRPDPIPFYAEMGSSNPVFVTKAAVKWRGHDIFTGYVDSFTLGAGQFCTKPGLLFVAERSSAAEEIANALSRHSGNRMLNERVARQYADSLATLSKHAAVRTVVEGTDTGAGPTPTLLATTMAQFLNHSEDIRTECFGPTSILVDYTDENDLLTAAQHIGGQLTATIHGEDDDMIAAPLLAELAEHVGRVLWGGWPTGVAVSWAMQHGGPYPATTVPSSTSVGTSAIDRFLRPVAYQSVPHHLLPQALHDDNPLGLPRRIDGVPPMQLP